MCTVIRSTRETMKIIHNLLSNMIILGLVLLFIIPAFASDSQGQWTDHPALQPFDLSEVELPDNIYLVRTRGSLPQADGIVVHGAHQGLYIISGDSTAIMGLVEQGCGVFPLQKPDAADDYISLTPYRTWTPATTPDPNIEAMVAQVNWTGISTKIQWLVDFGTRYSYAANHFSVVGALADRFVSYGFTPVLFSYEYGGTPLWNVEATQTGTVYPDSFIVICGHFDSVSGDPYVSAPGADDNGTGTATVLTAAEILSQYDFEYSIRYICFSGEEQGLRGSQAYASWAAANDIGIVGALNFDMLGYWEPGVEQDLEIETNDSSVWLAQVITNAADLYTDATYELHVYGGAWWGDHASFWAEGYAAVNHEEAWDWGDPDFNPYYHTINDLLIYIGEDFMVDNIQIGVATVATLAIYDPGSSGVNSESLEPVLSNVLNAQPNPFREQIEFTVTGLLHSETTRILIYDVSGRQVDVLNVNLTGGEGYAQWITGSSLSHEVGPGVYFARIEDASTTDALRLVHIE